MKQEIEELKKKLMADIEAGKITSTPKWKIVMWGVSIVFLLVAFFIFSSFIFSYLFFNMRFTGVEELLSFGSRGLLMFFALFPWKYLILDIIVLALIFHLAQNFRLVWQSSRAIIMLVLFGGALVAGFLIDMTSIHEFVFERRNSFPNFARTIYNNRLPEDIQEFTRGMVLYMDNSEVLIVDERTGDIGIITDFVSERKDFGFGDCVVVAGERIDGAIKAFGIARRERCFSR